MLIGKQSERFMIHSISDAVNHKNIIYICFKNAAIMAVEAKGLLRATVLGRGIC